MALKQNAEGELEKSFSLRQENELEMEDSNLLDEQVLSEGFEITDRSTKHLLETRKWAVFISIIGFLFSAFLLVSAISLFDHVNKAKFPTNPLFPSYYLMLFVYVISGLVYIALFIFLTRFAVGVNSAIRQKDSVRLEDAFWNLKIHYRLMGILIILSILFMIWIFTRDFSALFG